MQRRYRNLERVTTVLILIGGLMLVAADQLFGLDPSPPIEENRYLAKLPSIAQAESLAAFREDFERYYRDHLGFRDLMIRWNSRYRIELLGAERVRAGDPTIYVGNDDWLFLGFSLRDYTGEQRLEPGQLAWWGRTLEERQRLVETFGARYVFAPAPAKASIYPEYLPSSVRRRDGPLALDRLVQLPAGATGSPVLDLRPALRRAREWHQLYWETDHHWNSAGAAAAVESMVAHIRRWFPEEPRLDPTALHCDERPNEGPTSLARVLGLADRYPETRHRMRHPDWDADSIEETKDAATGNSIWLNAAREEGLRVLCIGDSFMFELLPFLTQRFHYTRFASHLPPDYDLESLRELLQDFQPDLVIEERTEWGLLEVPGGP